MSRSKEISLPSIGNSHERSFRFGEIKSILESGHKEDAHTWARRLQFFCKFMAGENWSANWSSATVWLDGKDSFLRFMFPTSGNVHIDQGEGNVWLSPRDPLNSLEVKKVGDSFILCLQAGEDRIVISGKKSGWSKLHRFNMRIGFLALKRHLRSWHCYLLTHRLPCVCSYLECLRKTRQNDITGDEESLREREELSLPYLFWFRRIC